MKPDAFDLKQRLGGEIAITTVRTTYNGHILDDEQIRSFAITSRHSADLNPRFATQITRLGVSLHSLDTVMNTNLSVCGQT